MNKCGQWWVIGTAVGWACLGIGFSIGLAEEKPAEQKAEAKVEVKAEPKAEAKAEKDEVLVEAVEVNVALVPGQAPEIKKQVRCHLRMIWNQELHLLHAICGLTEEQKRPIQAAAEKSFDKAASLLTKEMERRQQGMWGQTADPRRTFSSGIKKALKALAPEQEARYQAELEKRKQSQNRAMARLVVAKLDVPLTLSEEQREKLHEALTKDWQELWSSSIQLWQHNEEYYPQIDAQVLPHLNEKQKRIFQGFQRYGNPYFNLNLEDQGPEPAPWDEPAVDARPPAPPMAGELKSP